MSRLALRRHASVHGRWELAECPPCAWLAEHVVGTCKGYREFGAVPVRRREIPIGSIVLVFNLGDPFDIASTAEGATAVRFPRSFVAGLHGHAVIVGSAGSAQCLQVDLTPVAARRLLAVPLDLLADRVVPLADVLGRAVDELEERLDAAVDWPARLALLQAWLCARLARAPAAPAALDWGWRRLRETGGRLAVAEIQREIGCSRRHLAMLFRQHVGASPKRLARILRFERAVAMLDHPIGRGWADIAADCGYSDQAHLTREFRELAGMTPGELRRRHLPDGAGIVG